MARVSMLPYRNGANIAHADQHQDAEAGLFFTRVECHLAGSDLERVVLSRAVKWLLDHRMLAYGDKTVVFD